MNELWASFDLDHTKSSNKTNLIDFNLKPTLLISFFEELRTERNTKVIVPIEIDMQYNLNC